MCYLVCYSQPRFRRYERVIGYLGQGTVEGTTHSLEPA